MTPYLFVVVYTSNTTQMKISTIACQKSCVLGALCTGSYLLAKAQLLTGYRCTIHWENIASAREQIPNLVISSNLFEIDRDRKSCGGELAPIDMMLTEIRNKHGENLSMSIAHHFQIERIRKHDQRQRVALSQRIGMIQPKLTHVVSLMEANIEEPMSLDELSLHANNSRRQL